MQESLGTSLVRNRAIQPTLSTAPTSTTDVVSLAPHGERVCFNLFGRMKVLSTTVLSEFATSAGCTARFKIMSYVLSPLYENLSSKL